MAEIETFQGFFSYARHDAETDPKLIEALTARLEKRVSGKLTNAHFIIWRDVNAIRTGQRWDERIGEAVRASHVFIVLMTPKWFESAYCRKEYEAFQAIEPDVGEYVVPLLARPIDRQIESFDQAQKDIQDSLDRRQYRKIIATDFLLQSDDQRNHFIDKIADDIEGMIQRLRSKPVSAAAAGTTTSTRRTKRSYEFSANAHNLEDVDFVSAAEILVEPRNGDAQRSVYAHLGFVERLYVKTTTARVEFSIRRAYLSINDGGVGKLERNPDWAPFGTSGSVYYLDYKHAPPKAITVCINPQPGKTGIADLPLPAAKDENYLSMPAKAAPDTDIGSIHAELTVSLCPEGLFIAGEDVGKLSAACSKKITAVTGVLAAKNQGAGNSGRVSRRIPVRERKP